MAMKSIAARLRKLIRNFAAARDGNIAILFGLASIPVVGLMGAALDYSRANAVRADLQSALDSTALMVSKNAGSMTAEQLQGAADSYFAALFQNPAATSFQVIATYNSSGGSSVVLDGTASVPTDFMGILGISTMNIGSSATVEWGTSRLRVALALDNTGSMATNNKMTALKTAAKNLLTQLQAAAQKPGDVYVSVIPFNKDVNVGNAAKTASWLDWRAWNNKNGSCSDNDYKTQKNCEKNDKIWTTSSHDIWDGCVMDRNQDHDVLNTAPNTDTLETLFSPEQYGDCDELETVMPLSYDWTALKTKIDGMTPAGNTNVTIGLSWGWQALTEGAPLFAPAEDPKFKYQKVIILLTDGQNTQNRFSNNQKEIDDRTKKACANAKAAGIIIYTVRVMDGSQSLLQACATSPERYFHLQSADGLVSAFNQIGTELTQLRLAK